MSHPVVLITGALTGIGRATSRSLSRSKAPASWFSGRRDDVGEALVAELRALGAEAEFIRADVRHESDVQTWSTGRSPGSAPRGRRQQRRHRGADPAR